MTFSVFLTISGLNKEGEIRMKRLLLAVITLSTLCVNAGKSAQTAEATKSTEVATARPVEFYVGVSVGHDRMTAKRTEQVVTITGVHLPFFTNKTQTRNGMNGKVIAGFLWTVPNTAFVLSPEIYIGRGSILTLKESAFAEADNAMKTYKSTLKQSLAVGAVLRSGFYLTGDNNFLYGLVGIDRSKFENKFMLSSTEMHGVAIPTLVEKRRKFFNSPVFGVGFERKFNAFKVGIDCRCTSYSGWGNYSKKILVSDDTLSISLKPKITSTSLTFCYLF